MGSLAICTRRNTQTRKLTIMLDSFYDAQAGTVLGRDFKSWAKILTFYAVYYSFLGVLFWGFTITFYQGQMVEGPSPLGGKPVVRNSRLDQPGGSALPFNFLGGSYDINMKDSSGDHRVVLKADSTSQETQNYCNQLEKTFNTSTVGSDNCGNDVTTYDEQCAMSVEVNKAFCDANDAICNGVSLKDGFCSRMMKVQKPVVALNINKIVDWTPINKDYKNAIQFNCYEFNAKTQKKTEDSKFTFVQVSAEDALLYKYFPYPGLEGKQSPKMKEEGKVSQTNPAYNKPFVAYAVVPNDDKSWGTGVFHDFRCEVIAENINRPTKDGAVKLTESASKDLFKIGVGSVEFGISF